jgi:hypothetical protein
MTAPCPEAFVHADAAAGADGRIYGFARFRGRGCNDRIWYFEGDGASWTSQVTPYKGRILGVARGGGPTTYLLYSDGRNARITKRVGGTFSPGRAIGGVPGGGDVIAAGGTWWAVWREGARRLKEARAGGRSRPVPIAVGDFGKDNTSFLVSLAPRPGGGAVVAAECCRKAGPDPYEDIGAIQVGVTANGVWMPRFRFERNDAFEQPQAASSGRVTWLAWIRGSQVQVTSNRSGSFAEHTFETGGWLSLRLAASGGRAFLAWDAAASGPQVAFAEQAPDGTWTEARASQVSANPQRLVAITAVDEKATVLMMSPTRLYARTQT